MTNPARYSTLVLRSSLWRPAFALVLLCALTMMATQSAQAQTFAVIHNFTGGQDGAFPETGLTLGAAGNLYGTTNAGGQIEGGNCPGRGCGIVFKMTNRDGSWPLTPLCTNCLTGSLASSRPAIASNGVLYGTTLAGGMNDDGLVYQLRPPAQPPDRSSRHGPIHGRSASTATAMDSILRAILPSTRRAISTERTNSAVTILMASSTS